MSALLDHRGAPMAPSSSLTAPQIEFHETWLYYQLVAAANARSNMDRAPSWGEFEDARVARANAVARASHHYRILVAALGPKLDSLLASMALTEGLTP